MPAEFRQRKPGEFLQMFKRSKWHIMLPTLAVGIAVAYVVIKLPDMYESKTLLTLKPAQISTKVVESLTEEDLSQRLQTMNQEILSRSTLEPMVSKYKLFESEKISGMPTELIIDKMRNNIRVEPEKAEDGKVTGFQLTYRDRSPEAARNVAAELAGKYVNQQVTQSIESADKTREFIEKQMAEAKSILDTIEQQRLQIMMQNVDTLPESAQGLIAQLTSLGQREQTLSKEKETLIVEKGRLNESIRTLNSQMNLVQQFGKKDTDEQVTDNQIEGTTAYGELIKRRADLTAKLVNLKKVFREKHPDVIETETQIEKINDEIEKLRATNQKRNETTARRSNDKVQAQIKSLEIDRQRAESQIAQIEQQIRLKEAEMQQNAAQIIALEAKINTIPNVKVALEAINNQYQTAKTNFDELNKKKGDAQLQLQRDQNAQGETIRVVDSANLPQSPVNASKKPMFIMMGSAVGFAIGLFLAGLFEIPRLFKIQNIEDAKHYTGLPVLASVPPLLTRQEISWQKRSYWLKVLAGIIAAFGCIPGLIILLQKARIFERMVS
jgi:succinoglycan biosynthesis transport protein ExoP